VQHSDNNFLQSYIQINEDSTNYDAFVGMKR
jgi:hypothetical protein